MYIHPFAGGVLVTILAEISIVLICGIIKGVRDNLKQDNTGGRNV